jgi:hypothetical protein
MWNDLKFCRVGARRISSFLYVPHAVERIEGILNRRKTAITFKPGYCLHLGCEEELTVRFFDSCLNIDLSLKLLR